MLRQVISTLWTESPSVSARQVRGYGLIFSIFFFPLMVTLVVSWWAINVVDSTRAYVNGEGRYSKAEKIAVLDLHRYAYSGSQKDYQDFLAAIAVPLGDHAARIALERSPADFTAAANGFLKGENHPLDIVGMLALFDRFSWWPPFAAAIADWENGDRLVGRLIQEAARLRNRVVAHALDDKSRMESLGRIDRLDDQLSSFENAFSAHLGAAARVEAILLIFGLGVTTIALWTMGVALATHLFRKQETLDRQLSSSEARFRDFAEIASDWYWEMGADYRIMYMSERFYSLVGLEPGSALGRSCVDFIQERAANPQHRDMCLAALREYQPFRGAHLRFQHRDGNSIYCSIAGKPHFDLMDQFLGFRGVGSDITAAVQDAQVLREAKERAEVVNRAKSEFLANMSHELRTPLNAIMGFAEMINSRLLGPLAIERYVEYAGDIRESGQHLLSIIDDVLDLSKIEAGHIKLREHETKLDRIAESVRTLLGDRFERTGILFRVDLPAPAPRILVDERKIIQILLNLLSNAIKFTAPGGEVTLGAAVEADGGVSIHVRDTGIGIAAHDLETVLSPFGQVESAFRRTHHGTGLGLPLAKSLTELHGGTLSLKSAPGTGTTVTIWLPARRVLNRSRAPIPAMKNTA